MSRKKGVGRPQKNPYRRQRVHMYLKNPQAIHIHTILAERGHASEFYETALLRHYGKLAIPADKEATMLKEKLVFLQSLRDRRIATIEQTFEVKLRETAKKLSELEPKESDKKFEEILCQQ